MRKKNKKGYTLIEIIICLTLIVMIGGLSLIILNKNTSTKNVDLDNVIEQVADVYLSVNKDMENLLNTNGYLTLPIEKFIDTGLLKIDDIDIEGLTQTAKDGEDYNKVLIKSSEKTDNDLGFEIIYPWIPNTPSISFDDYFYYDDFYTFNDCEKGLNNELRYFDENYNVTILNIDELVNITCSSENIERGKRTPLNYEVTDNKGNVYIGIRNVCNYQTRTISPINEIREYNGTLYSKNNSESFYIKSSNSSGTDCLDSTNPTPFTLSVGTFDNDLDSTEKIFNETIELKFNGNTVDSKEINLIFDNEVPEINFDEDEVLLDITDNIGLENNFNIQGGNLLIDEYDSNNMLKRVTYGIADNTLSGNYPVTATDYVGNSTSSSYTINGIITTEPINELEFYVNFSRFSNLGNSIDVTSDDKTKPYTLNNNSIRINVLDFIDEGEYYNGEVNKTFKMEIDNQEYIIDTKINAYFKDTDIYYYDRNNDYNTYYSIIGINSRGYVLFQIEEKIDEETTDYTYLIYNPYLNQIKEIAEIKKTQDYYHSPYFIYRDTKCTRYSSKIIHYFNDSTMKIEYSEKTKKTYCKSENSYSTTNEYELYNYNYSDDTITSSNPREATISTSYALNHNFNKSKSNILKAYINKFNDGHKQSKYNNYKQIISTSNDNLDNYEVQTVNNKKVRFFNLDKRNSDGEQRKTLTTYYFKNIETVIR